jgi:glyoxylase-like metal-dependent hydrolase (beta-lactamase superfamily II)/rhodanese-related sulfurtransferase
MVVVDPKRDIQDYLDISRDEGMQITKVIETHIHADHVSGNQELRSQTGAEIHLLQGSGVDYEHRALQEGQRIEFGAVRIEVLATPGHTPYACSLLVSDLLRSPSPWLILTGDLLFVGAIGRPDLAGREILDEQIDNLYQSLYLKLGRLPDHLEVYPAHGQGSLCGQGLSSKPSSTLGYERLTQPALRYTDRAAFHRDMAGSFPVRPKSFTHIIETNRKGPPLLERCPLERALNPDRFKVLWEQGATVIDTRDAGAFGGFHIPKSVNIGFEKQMANWIGMVIDPKAELLLVVEDRARYEQMTVELHRIGYDNILGYLAGGMSAWINHGLPIDGTTPISVQELSSRLQAKDLGSVIDVRTPEEHRQGYIAGSRHLPMTEIMDSHLDEDLDSEIVLVCGTGYRSNIVASRLKQAGSQQVRGLAGGTGAWVSAGYPLEQGP